jgi:Ala-tRNA(Pro) deacylase
MPASKLKNFLDENGIKYVVISHSPAYAAQEIAAAAHISGKELAKTVIVKSTGKMMMVVLPASYQIELGKLGSELGVSDLKLATENEFKDLFPGCDVGAMPPFGNLYDMDVVVAKRLTEDDEIAFNAGTHTELIKLKYDDFERLVKPKVLQFT